MNRQINFVVPSPPEYLSLYQKVISGIVAPIRVHLPESTVSNMPVPGAVNIHFFNEGAYRAERVTGCDGVHVFMSHGMGDKKWRDGPMVEYYDYICVSGPAWVEKMLGQGIPRDKVLVTGFPKLDPLFQGIVKKSAGAHKRCVLYAPTHGGSAPCTSYPDFLDYVGGFPADLHFELCAHPYHREENRPVLQELANADVVISDGSSVIYEALSLGKPAVFPDWLVKEAILQQWPDSFTARIYREGIGYHAENFEHLIALIYKAMEKGPSDHDMAFIDGILPPALRGRSGEASAEIFRKLAA